MSSLTTLFTNIANAIRSKTGSQATIVANDFPTAISAIQVGGGELNFGQSYGESAELRDVLVKTGTVTIPSNRTDLSYLFDGCEHLTEVSLFDTSNATNMECMFQSCFALTSVPNFNTANVTNFSNMFDGCEHLTTAPSINTASGQNFTSMFNYCDRLTTVPNYTTTSATIMDGMFCGCSALVTAPTMNTSSVTSMDNMFEGCGNLQHVPAYNTSSCTSMAYMFSGCGYLDSTSLNNILAMCAGVSSSYVGDKYFEEIGLEDYVGELEELSNYSAAVAAGWSSNGGE